MKQTIDHILAPVLSMVLLFTAAQSPAEIEASLNVIADISLYGS
jgi:hypothetical protein